LNRGTPKPHGPIAVIAAGTGLGEGGLVWDGSRYLALPSEGGHADFAPRTELEIDLLRYMLQKHHHVSNERLLSGPGLYETYRFFRSRAEHDEPKWLRDQIALGDASAVVSQAALERKDGVCEQALEMFVSLYGAEAGNLALRLLSTGGVYIGGGIAPKILVKLQEGSFMKAFTAKGRHAELLREIPVHVILNDQIALLGAAHYAVMMQ
jgi:glucokinase